MTNLNIVPMTTLKTDKPKHQWGTIVPLMTANGGAPYPIDALPTALKKAVIESVNIVKCPVVMAASSALATLATACQGIANIQPNQNLKPSPLSLFFMQIAKSGERKSTIDSLFTEVIKLWSQQKQDDLKTEYLQAESIYKAWSYEVEGVTNAIKNAATKGQDTANLRDKLSQLESNPPPRGRLPKMTYGDTTPEALLYGLGHKWASAAVLSSEGGVIFGGHGMNSDAITRNLATYNTLWMGETTEVDRKQENGSFIVANVRLSMSVGIQPDLIQGFFDKNPIARSSGFAARFLVAYPESTQGNRTLSLDELSTPTHKNALNLFYSRINTLLEQHLGNINNKGQLDLPTLRLSTEALQVWVDYFNNIESTLKAGGTFEDYSDIASKSADNAARLAGLFHLFGGGDISEPINSKCMYSACQVAIWHLYEAKRFYDGVAVPTEIHNATKLEIWLKQYFKQHQDSTIARKTLLQRVGYAPLRKSGTLNEALEILETANRIRQFKEQDITVYELNPELLRG